MWGWLRERSNRDRAKRETQLDRIERKIEMADAKISDMQPLVDAIATELPTIVASGTNAIELLKQLQNSAANPNTTTTLSPDDQTKLNTMLGQLQGVKSSADTLLTTLNTATSPAASPPPSAPPGATPPSAPSAQIPQPSAPPEAAPPSTPAPTPPAS